MEVKIKKLHKDAVIPKYAKPGDAGMDLTATSMEYDEDGNWVYGTGLAFEIPEGYVGMLFPRSSNAKTRRRPIVFAISKRVCNSCLSSSSIA